MIDPVLIGIDIGTSGAKAAVIDSTGRLLSWSGREYPIQTPRAGWAEQDPQDWQDAALACVCDALREAGASPQKVAGIGLAGQMHSLVCVGDGSRVLRPAILWADQRSGGQARRLATRIGRENLARWTGNPIAAGFMLASWAWLVEHEPETARATRLLMLPKDYLRLRLTGLVGSEPSDASSTLLFDPHQRCWSDAMLRDAGLDAGRLPPIFPSEQVAGGLLPEIARACELPSGVPVIHGGSDVSLQALANGIIAPGDVSCTIGTGGQVFAPLASATHDPELRLHLFCHVLPGVWHQEAAILSAGLALRWLRDALSPGASYNTLANAAAGVQAALDGLFFLPFLAGERTPYMNPRLRGGFIGLQLRHGQAALARAVMEGVVFALKQCLERMRALGAPVEHLVATGGATRHPLWLQLQANIFNQPIYVSGMESSDSGSAGTARGAALLAGAGTGVFPGITEAVRAAVLPPRLAAAPDPRVVGAYAHAYEDYVRWAGDVSARYPLDETGT